MHPKGPTNDKKNIIDVVWECFLSINRYYNFDFFFFDTNLFKISFMHIASVLPPPPKKAVHLGVCMVESAILLG